ncbi:MAG: alpha/beta hydrolase [Ornithinimicrobium sp.]
MRWLVVGLAVVAVAQFAIPDAPQVGNFRSVQGRGAYVEAYEQVLNQLPPPSKTVGVATRFGTVRVYEWSPAGPEVGPPVVLLPGRTSGAPMWRDNLEELIGTRKVVALDALGDAGFSEQAVPIRDMADQAAWVDDVLNTISPDEGVHLVGHSFGGATAAAYARAHPDRLASLTLLEPVFTLGSPPLSIYLWSSLILLPTPQSWRDEAMRRIGGTDDDPASQDQDDPLARMIDVGAREYSAKLPTPTVLDSRQLGELSMPVYVGIAATSSLAGGLDAAETARENLPDATVKVWPHTTHSLPMQVPTELAETLTDFWDAATQP